jgi:hypothetical protein
VTRRLGRPSATDIDVRFGFTVGTRRRIGRRPRTISDFRLTLARLGFTRPGEVFWLTTTPEVSDEEVALLTAGR